MNLPTNSQPPVSILVPVYNESRFLKQTIHSLLSQSFADFEILVFDNASTDDTWDQILEFARLDSRVRPHRNAANIGTAKNFTAALAHAQGTYFSFCGGHDVWHPEHLRVCVDFLENNEGVCLVQTDTAFIDTQNRSPGIYDRFIHTVGTSGGSPVDRLITVLWTAVYCTEYYGLIRRSAATGFDQPITILGDLYLLCWIALKGDIAHIPGAPFYWRILESANDWGTQLSKTLNVSAGGTRGGGQQITYFYDFTHRLMALVDQIEGLPDNHRELHKLSIAACMHSRYFIHLQKLFELDDEAGKRLAKSLNDAITSYMVGASRCVASLCEVAVNHRLATGEAASSPSEGS